MLGLQVDFYPGVYIRVARRPLTVHREAGPPKTAYQRGAHLIDVAHRQITHPLPPSGQPIITPLFVHIIYGAIRVGWAVRGPQKFDSFTGETPVQRLFHFTFQFIFPEHWSLWAWGCHTQKTTTRRQTIPAAWAKRKRTGRLRKVRLVFSEGGEGRMRLSSSWWQTAWIVSMPPDWQPLSTAPSVVLRCDHPLIPSGACTDVTGMLRLCVLAIMHAWLSQQQLAKRTVATAFRSLAWI